MGAAAVIDGLLCPRSQGILSQEADVPPVALHEIHANAVFIDAADGALLG